VTTKKRPHNPPNLTPIQIKFKNVMESRSACVVEILSWNSPKSDQAAVVHAIAAVHYMRLAGLSPWPEDNIETVPEF